MRDTNFKLIKYKAINYLIAIIIQIVTGLNMDQFKV